MKKDIGNGIALYPMPLVVLGAYVDGKLNWTLVGHLGIIGHDRMMISLAKPHFINKGIRETGVLSVNIVDSALLERADYVGCVSGHKKDKSQVFSFEVGKCGAPLITKSPLSMECKVVDVYETAGFESFILSVEHTYAEESVLDEKGKIDYRKVKPVLFEMPTYEYLETGEVLGKCMSFAASAH